MFGYPRSMSSTSICLLVLLLTSSTLSMSVGDKRREISGQECPMVGLDCLFHDIERAANSQSWQECARQCAQNRLCIYWSWRLPSSPVNPYGCWLKSECPFTLPDINLVSGEFSCTE